MQLLAGKHAGVVQQWSAAAGLDGARLLVSGALAVSPRVYISCWTPQALCLCGT